MDAEMETVNSAAKLSEVERSNSKKKRPAKLSPIMHKPKSKFLYIILFRNEPIGPIKRSDNRYPC